jgi:hypothetical protein
MTLRKACVIKKIADDGLIAVIRAENSEQAISEARGK